MEYSISTEKPKLDIEAIHNFLCNRSYWAKGRSFEHVQKSIENSMCFAIYDNKNKMPGFARVVTDNVAFLYLMDVFILEEHQGKGPGKMLVKHIVEHPQLQVKLKLLGTVNAHGLYKKLGFSELKNPERYLTIKNESCC